jgi:hypothetical protein
MIEIISGWILDFRDGATLSYITVSSISCSLWIESKSASFLSFLLFVRANG